MPKTILEVVPAPRPLRVMIRNAEQGAIRASVRLNGYAHRNAHNRTGTASARRMVFERGLWGQGEAYVDLFDFLCDLILTKKGDSNRY